jgi:hypothetical protein
MFHLDYLSCFLTVLATILLARKSWIGLLIAIVNCLIVCVIGLRTLQFGFIPANLFCICVYAFSMRSWLKPQTHTHREQAQRQDSNVAHLPVELRKAESSDRAAMSSCFDKGVGLDESLISMTVPGL